MTRVATEYAELPKPLPVLRVSTGRTVLLVGYWRSTATGQRIAAVVLESRTIMNLHDLQDVSTS